MLDIGTTNRRLYVFELGTNIGKIFHVGTVDYRFPANRCLDGSLPAVMRRKAFPNKNQIRRREEGTQFTRGINDINIGIFCRPTKFVLIVV